MHVFPRPDDLSGLIVSPDERNETAHILDLRWKSAPAEAEAWADWLFRAKAREVDDAVEKMVANAPRRAEELAGVKAAAEALVAEVVAWAERTHPATGRRARLWAGDVGHKLERQFAPDWFTAQEAFRLLESVKSGYKALDILARHHPRTLKRFERWGWFARGCAQPRLIRAWAKLARATGKTEAPSVAIRDVATHLGDVEEFQPNGELRVNVRSTFRGLDAREKMERIRGRRRVGGWIVSGPARRYPETIWLRWRSDGRAADLKSWERFFAK